MQSKIFKQNTRQDYWVSDTRQCANSASNIDTSGSCSNFCHILMEGSVKLLPLVLKPWCEFISGQLHHWYVEQDWKSLKWTLIPCLEQLSVPSERAMRVLASEKLPPAELVSFLLDLETPASCLCKCVLLVLYYFWKSPPPPLIFSQSEHFKDWTMKSLCSNKQKHAVQRMWANALFVQGNTVVHWPKILSIRHPSPCPFP